MNKSKPLVLILCGGQSLRLWPLSQYKSKNFLDIFGFSPLEITIKRFLKITTRDNIFLVANKNEKKELTKLKLIKKSNIFFEPESKNTAAAILLACLNLQKHCKRTLIISPVDHLIEKEKQFFSSINRALKAAGNGDICTLGIKPTEPTSNLGYIQVSGSSKVKSNVFSVKQFIEKPAINKAKQLIAEGNCFYNSGIFIVSINTLINEYKKYYSNFDYFVKNFNKKKIPLLYKKIINIPFDKAIMEKSKNIKVVKGEFCWSDFGNWQTIYETLSKDEDGNVRKGKVTGYKSKNNLIYLDNPKKKVLSLGLEDIFFIDTKDYTLLASRKYLNCLKQVLKK